MTNTEYTEKTLQANKRIYIDTATLMDTEGMRRFIANSKAFLEDARRKIIVPHAVYLELARHLESKIPSKRLLSMNAIALISENPDIFQVESAPATKEEIEKAFADAQLLSELTLHKGECDQLLITNDKQLSSDAFSLNKQQSCKGHRIMVCYINKSGELHRCSCVTALTTAKLGAAGNALDKAVTPTQTAILISNQESEPLRTSQYPKRQPFNWVSCFIGFIIGVGVCAAGRGCKAIIPVLK